MNIQELREWISEAEKGEKYPLAKLISSIERKDSFSFRKTLFQELSQHPELKRNSITIGITGTPGAGKSSLIGELCHDFLKKQRRKKLAVVAIDPSSKLSGGSILGDRTRVVIPARENRIFFRSQASQLELGGVNPYTYHVIRLLRYFFDYIIIETVGIGQNETEVSRLADYSFLILQPLAGDGIQFMKSGIMEVPDAFIINKCDEKELATSSFHMLISSLEFLKDTLNGNTIPRIFQTSALKKIGIDSLLEFMLNIQEQKSKEMETKEQIEKMIRSEYGNFGVRVLQEVSSTQSQFFMRQYETIEEDFNQEITKRIR
ncbi:MAG TPA: GTP-binding protein [Leptospiraceae bacterium]|nr:GTP-binding protein [Leptospiraceae bacterium]HMW03855.1 GTP-binding protein [Leptospiraceae bacterium]HMX32904.1 GTP-binding protein [Leptospiraceae bacterium]HMY29835.1 GTP-binding protein [Leptospiraceae bacterium]HMZ65183.1 GTP-binding protein [Leptospiraceae bacterium]